MLTDVEHDMGEAAALAKDGVERDLQELAAEPRQLGEGLQLVAGSGRPTSARST